MKVAIVIPYYNRWDLTHQRLYELYKYVPNNITAEIILVNDASPELDCETGVSWWQKTGGMKVRYKRNEENKGFGGSMNVGAKIALHYDADIIILLSNDVRVSGDFVSEIVAKLTDNPRSLIGGEVVAWPGGWNEFVVDGKPVVVPYANGWLLACTADAWRELGGFDPIYGKYDYEDLDLSTTAISKGYSIIGLYSQHVRHAHQGSTIQTIQSGEDRLAHTQRNRKIYEDKWLSRLDSITECEDVRDKSGSRAEDT